MRKIIFSTLILSILTLQGCNGEGPNEKTSEKSIEFEATKGDVLDKTEESNYYGKPVKLNKEDFLVKVMNYEKNQTEWKFEGDLPCIIDFYADWCAPCKMVSPVLEELASEYAGKINIYKIDTQKERELAAVFGIKSIPSFLICGKEGKPQMSSGIARTPGETKEMFKKIIDEQLLNVN